MVTQASLERVLEAALPGSPDGILVSGDLSQDETRDSYARLREILERAGVPVYCLPGNHDDLGLMQSELANARIAVLGDHTLGGWRLLATDCTIPGAVHGEYGDDRMAALDRSLGEVPTQPTIVALHHPPLDCGRHQEDDNDRPGEKALMVRATHFSIQIRAFAPGQRAGFGWR